MRKDYRLGAIVGVYILFKNNRHEATSPAMTGTFSNPNSNRHDDAMIGTEITKVILEEVF